MNDDDDFAESCIHSFIDAAMCNITPEKLKAREREREKCHNRIYIWWKKYTDRYSVTDSFKYSSVFDLNCIWQTQDMHQQKIEWKTDKFCTKATCQLVILIQYWCNNCTRNITTIRKKDSCFQILFFFSFLQFNKHYMFNFMNFSFFFHWI